MRYFVHGRHISKIIYDMDRRSQKLCSIKGFIDLAFVVNKRLTDSREIPCCQSLLAIERLPVFRSSFFDGALLRITLLIRIT